MPESVTLVWGPPCAGKNTYVREHAARGDLVVDFDALITALGGAGSHDQPAGLVPFAFEAANAVLRRVADSKGDVGRVWVIRSAPRRVDRKGFDVRVCLLPPKQVCLERAVRERPASWVGYIEKWFKTFEPD